MEAFVPGFLMKMVGGGSDKDESNKGVGRKRGGGEDSDEWDEKTSHIVFHSSPKIQENVKQRELMNDASSPAKAATRVFLRGVRNGVTLNFSGMSWVKNKVDASLLKVVARVAANCAVRDGASICDLSVYNEVVDNVFYSGDSSDCLTYRMVIMLASNVPVSNTTMDAIRSCSPDKISSISAVTYIPPGYRRPTGVKAEDEDYKLYVSRGSKYNGIVGGQVTTNITIYVSSEAYKRYQKIQSENDSFGSYSDKEGSSSVGARISKRSRTDS